MQTETIKQIKDYLDPVEDSLKAFILREHKGERFGPENEYAAESLKAGLKAILVDVRALARAHDKFLRLSIHAERSQIANFLMQMNNNLNEKNYSGVATNLDGLKSIIRQYNFRASPESEEILKDRISNIHSLCAKLEEQVEEVERISVRAQQSAENIQSAENRYAALDEIQKELEEKSNQINSFHTQGRSHSQEIANLLGQAKSHEGTLNHFATRVKEYEGHLAEYQDEHKKIQEQARELTNRARKALSDAAAASVSGAIHERYEEEKKKWWNLLWLFGSAVFAVISMWLGYMITDQESITLGVAVARITVMSVAISAAWFCASQYIRYRNTVDDYGYKSVLARSIVAFLDQFKDPDERAAYLETVLGQIHQDPMRKKHDVDTPTTNLFNKLRNRKTRENIPVAKDVVDDE